MIGKKVLEATPIPGRDEPEGPRDIPETLKYSKNSLFSGFFRVIQGWKRFLGKNPNLAMVRLLRVCTMTAFFFLRCLHHAVDHN